MAQTTVGWLISSVCPRPRSLPDRNSYSGSLEAYKLSNCPEPHVRLRVNYQQFKPADRLAFHARLRQPATDLQYQIRITRSWPPVQTGPTSSYRHKSGCKADPVRHLTPFKLYVFHERLAWPFKTRHRQHLLTFDNARGLRRLGLRAICGVLRWWFRRWRRLSWRF